MSKSTHKANLARAKANREAKAGPINEATRKRKVIELTTSDDGELVTVFATRKDKAFPGQDEYMHFVTNLPTNTKMSRDDLLNFICRKNPWLHDEAICIAILNYLVKSQSLIFARMGMNVGMMMDVSGTKQEIDLDDLGCVIEFVVDGKHSSCPGPQWKSGKEVLKLATKHFAKLGKQTDYEVKHTTKELS